MNIKAYLPILVIFIICSCTKDIDLDLSDGNVIVVNSILSPDSLIHVQISQSQNISDSSETIALNDADVSIYKDTTFIENLVSIGNGIYESSFTPNAEATYSINVSSGSLTPVTSSTTIPAKIKIDSITWTNSYNYSITITDDGSEDNYYLLKLLGTYIEYDYSTRNEETYEFTDSTMVFTNLSLSIDDEVICPSDNGSSTEQIINSMEGIFNTSTTYHGDWLAFSDKNIAGTTYTLQININTGDFFISEEYPLYFIFETINKDYYYYLYSITYPNEYLLDQINSVNSVYTNIENGAGLFSSANISIDTITGD